ncbi:MAG TPA: PVC-type heme-binding CxxCH protein [Fimbriiglobus sp.]|nr:PVC-type heme-binding CxxCH protein [Fimbriiglobus sp.]
MNRYIFLLLALPGFALLPAADGPAPKSPLSPGAEKATFRLAPGLRIDLIAAEPQIESPVACAFDESGKLWVVEMLDYPNGPAKGEPGQGRIKVLEDRDGDGRYEHATVFADQLLFANGLLHWDGGVIVTAAPHILFLKDTDCDGKADRRDVLYEGFTAGNPQLRVSHPNIGPDGWVYVANGLRGGEVRRHGKPDAKAIPLGGKDFRFNLVDDQAEAIPGMGQYGNTFDRWGNRFVCDNRNHLRHVVFPTDPGARNPLLVAPQLLEDTAGASDGPLSSGRKVYPLSRNWTTSNLHAGRFTAACGVFIDKGGLLPEPFADGAFTCDPTGNLVHMETLIPDGSTFRSKPWKEGVEFLASPDEWFRPVFLTQDPIGAVVLVDMYRAVIEHPEFMPTELKNRPDLKLGQERGRIWRIAPESSQPGGRMPDMGKFPTKELVQLLGHARGWHRATAQRLLLTSKDPDLADALIAFIRETESAEGKILAAWMLNAKKGKPPADLVKRLAGDGNARVREHAARLLELEKPAASEFTHLAADVDGRVRFQTALSLGVCDDAAVPLLANIATECVSDRWTRVAVASSSAGRTGKLVLALLGDRERFTAEPTADRRQLLQDLCELVGSGRNADEVGSVLSALTNHKPDWQRAALTGLAEGVARRGTSFPAFLDKLPDHRQKATALLTAATAPAADPKAGDEERTAAVQLLAHTPWDASGPVLTKLVSTDETPTPVRLAAVRSLAAHPRPEVAGLLLGGWRGYTPAVRSEVLEALIRSPARATALLDAVEAGKVRPADIDPARARRVVAMKDSKVAARAVKLLKDSLPTDRKEVMEKYRPALTMTADALRGREVFRKHCANCHVIAGVGVQVGPDISDTRTKTLEMLLTDVLTPNAAIDGNYISYTVTTLDGKSFTGVIASESAAGISLRREQNQTDTILRADIDELKSSGQSLMPEGLEKDVSVQEMADLIRFLKDWRYLDGATPRGK